MQYEVFLPVYKQGDDLDRCLELSDHDTVAALRLLASNYRNAAERCDDLAAFLDHNCIPAVLTGSNHWITVIASESLDTLTKPFGVDDVPLLTIVETDPDDEDLTEYLEQMDVPDTACHQTEMTW